MKRKLSFLFLSALTIPFFMGSCSDDKEEQEVKPATDLVVDNNSVTLLQGDEITVSITSGNGDYYVKPFDVGGYEASTEIAIARGNGDYKLAQLTEDNKVYLKTAELVTEDGTTKLKLTGKKLGTTTLELSDAAGQKLTLPVYVNPVCYRLEHDVCFKIDIAKSTRHECGKELWTKVK